MIDLQQLSIKWSYGEKILRNILEKMEKYIYGNLRDNLN